MTAGINITSSPDVLCTADPPAKDGSRRSGRSGLGCIRKGFHSRNALIRKRCGQQTSLHLESR